MQFSSYFSEHVFAVVIWKYVLLLGPQPISVYVVMWDNIFKQDCPALHSVNDSVPIGTPCLVIVLVGLDWFYSHAGRWII